MSSIEYGDGRMAAQLGIKRNGAEVCGFGSKRTTWGPQVAGLIFPFTNRVFWVPGIFDPNLRPSLRKPDKISARN